MAAEHPHELLKCLLVAPVLDPIRGEPTERVGNPELLAEVEVSIQRLKIEGRPTPPHSGGNDVAFNALIVNGLEDGDDVVVELPLDDRIAVIALEQVLDMPQGSDLLRRIDLSP